MQRNATPFRHHHLCTHSSGSSPLTVTYVGGGGLGHPTPTLGHACGPARLALFLRLAILSLRRRVDLSGGSRKVKWHQGLSTSAKGCPWYLSHPSAVPLLFSFLFWKAQVFVLYLTHTPPFFLSWPFALLSILCAALPGSTLCQTISSGAAHCPPHTPNTHRFRHFHSQPLPYFPS